MVCFDWIHESPVPALRILEGEEEMRAVTAWYRVTLSNSDVVARRHMELQKSFETLFLANQWPKQAAMFANVDSLAHQFYFSPGAVAIGSALFALFSGTECAKPEGEGLCL